MQHGAAGIRKASSREYPTETMSLSELKALLDHVADTRELVLRSAVRDPIWNEAYMAWSDAHVEAEEAYAIWRRDGGESAYLVYRAAQDREDAAQDALSAFTPAG
jgi:hypothetical protein